MLSMGVNGDGDFDNFISIFYNIEYSLMSKVKHWSDIANGDNVTVFQTSNE